MITHVEVSKKDLCNFFTLLHQVCPWFVITAPRIANSTWCRIGDELETFFRSKNDPAYRNVIMQYWQLLHGLIVNIPFSPTCPQILSSAQAALSSASRSASRASSCSSSVADLAASLDALKKGFPPPSSPLKPVDASPPPPPMFLIS